MRSARGRMVAVVVGLAGCLLSGCASTRTVESDSLYRAGPLSDAQLKESIRANKIQTVVNLRGFHPDEPWYRQQVATCEAERVPHVDVSLDPKLPGPGELQSLLTTYQTHDKPFLLVDGRGSTDAEFAASFYRRAVLGEPVQQASKELPFWQAYRLPLAPGRDRVTALKEWSEENRDAVATTVPIRMPREDGNERSRDSDSSNPDAARTDSAAKPKFFRRLQSWFRGNDEDYAYSSTGATGQTGARLNNYSGVIPDGPVAGGPLPVDRLPPVRRPADDLGVADVGGNQAGRSAPRPGLGTPQPLAAITLPTKPGPVAGAFGDDPTVNLTPLPSERPVTLGPPVAIDDVFFLGQ